MPRLSKVFQILSVLLLLTACAGGGDSKPPRGIKVLWDAKGPEAREWTEATATAVEAFSKYLLDRTPEDIADYCPSYPWIKREERLAFWVNFIAVMAKHESSFNTAATHQEKMLDRNGRPGISRGLLQLSVESTRPMGCTMTEDSELHEAHKNLTCGVRMLARYLNKDGRIYGHEPGRWFGAARYWNIFRLPDVHLQIRGELSALPYCERRLRNTSY